MFVLPAGMLTKYICSCWQLMCVVNGQKKCSSNCLKQVQTNICYQAAKKDAGGGKIQREEQRQRLGGKGVGRESQKKKQQRDKTSSWVGKNKWRTRRVKGWTKWNLTGKFAGEEYQEGRNGAWKGRKVTASRRLFTGWREEELRRGQMKIGGWLLQQIATGKDRWARGGGGQEAILHWYTVQQVFARRGRAVFDSWAEEAAHTGFVKALWRNGKGRAKNKQLSARVRLVDFQNNHMR